jgi:hypothetical protein
MTASSVAMKNNGRMRNEGNSGIIYEVMRR